MSNTNGDAEVAKHPLDLCADLLEGRAAMAEELGVSPTAIGNWKTRGVPIKVCVWLERRTCGEVTRQMLRPDDWSDIWPELVRLTRAANDERAVAHG